MPQSFTSWDTLYRILRAAFPVEQYHTGARLTKIENNVSQITTHFADGAAVQSDILVGADGVDSAVRSHFLPDAKPRYAGYVAWRVESVGM